MLPPKPAVLAALLAEVRARLAAAEQIAATARDEATGDETRQEGKYDTRATEASYLARGQAWRVAELRQLAAWCGVFDAAAPLSPSVVQVGALVRVEGDLDETLFIAPVGGAQLDLDGTTVRVISPSSPLGDALSELECDDAFEVDTPRGIQACEIVALA